MYTSLKGKKYIRDIHASMTRPVKELAGFKRLTLAPEEQKKVTFIVETSQIAFLDREMKWKVEKGEVEIQIGSSSEDIYLWDTINIKKDAWIEGKKRGFYALGMIK